MGAFWFKESINGDYINASEVLRIPPLTDIRELIAASSEIEKSEDENRLPEMRWILNWYNGLISWRSTFKGKRDWWKQDFVYSKIFFLYFRTVPMWRIIWKNCIAESRSIYVLVIQMTISAIMVFFWLPRGALYSAYDMSPSLNEYQSLLINITTNKSDLNELLVFWEEYMLPKQIASKPSEISLLQSKIGKY